MTTILLLSLWLSHWPFQSPLKPREDWVRAPISVSCVSLAEQDHCTVSSTDGKAHTLQLPDGPLIPFSGNRKWYFSTKGRPTGLVYDDKRVVKVKRID